jgi:hypothetical protein
VIQFLPYALAAYGGYRGYRDSKDQGITGINRLLNTALGAYTGYNLGQAGGFAQRAGFGDPASANFLPSFTQTQTGGNLANMLGLKSAPVTKYVGSSTAPGTKGGITLAPADAKEGGGILDILREGGDPDAKFSPGRVSAAIAAATYFGGAFDPQPTDIFMPGYNVNYLDMRAQRPGFKFIDPTTGEEKEYQRIYAPEESGKGDRRIGPYSFIQERLKEGGLAEIKKFNEGGINYLPSKMTHDENDANNYVRALGYVEDGAGVGDKDEDTMLAQLADGEFVTRADGVLGAGIIAGANPNSIKDMREKGAQYFYEQQRRYKRVFDLLKDRNESKQKN